MARPKNRSVKKVTLLAILAVVGILTVLYALQRTGVINLTGNSDFSSGEHAQTTSPEPSAQSDFQDGNDRAPGNTQHENEGTARISDTEGTNYQEATNPVSSATGEITVNGPKPNSIITSPLAISGKSSTSSVNYRIIDSNTGVIATGTLKVNNGLFSGELSFTTGAAEGRIDIFASRADGSEYSSVEIPVRFR